MSKLDQAPPVTALRVTRLPVTGKKLPAHFWVRPFNCNYDESRRIVGSTEWDFSKQLANYGPTALLGLKAPDDASALAKAEEYCRWVARTHYENFQIASALLPRLLRQDFHNIYAYCRWSDDLADEAGSPERAKELLAWWQEQLDQLFSDGPTWHPVMRALKPTIERHGLPRQPFADLLSAFVQDQSTLRYDSTPELIDYCRRSANPVGRLVLGLAGVADDVENLRLSDEICTGLQLANFCQDMQRDAALGRIYAPRELWHRHAVAEVQLMGSRPTLGMQAMLKEFVAMARQHLERGETLAARVPRWLSLDVRLFRAGGLAIVQQIERAGYDVWTRRPTVSRWRKVVLLGREYVRSRFARRTTTGTR